MNRFETMELVDEEKPSDNIRILFPKNVPDRKDIFSSIQQSA